jgi:NADP-dependent 3-hydroxy acid dehydrogenase YdfG
LDRDVHPESLRLRVRLTGERISLEAADAEGNPACSIEALALRKVDPAMLGSGATSSDDLFALGWTELDLASAPAVSATPELYRVTPQDPDRGPASVAHELTAVTLAALQAFLADEEKADQRLAILTEGAVAVDAGESPDPALAAVWGLVRSAQSEHPGRFLLVDADGSDASEAALAKALSQTDESQLALREGKASVPRLAPVGEQPPSEELQLDAERTVLVTGGLSGLGALTARHLATAHGAKHLLLTSRRGPEAPGAAELIAELAEAGCEARAVACDVSDREALTELLAGIPTERPLGALFHSAAALDDGLLADLSPERLTTVLAPKADAAWHLHELTADTELSAFVLYSSAVAALGGPGQGNYAAANSFLDALATRRRVDGRPATAIAWGRWESESELTAV